MINLLCSFRCDDHPIHLNQEFCLDLTWWHKLIQSWDGLSFFLMPECALLPDIQVSSDTTGTLGYGTIFNNQWFCGSWSASPQPLSTAYKELFPIVVASYYFIGTPWSSRWFEFLHDNELVVAALSSGTPRGSYLMVLMSFLALLAVHHSFSFKASSVLFVVKLTLLLMLPPISSFSVSGAWPLQQSMLPPQFLWISSQPICCLTDRSFPFPHPGPWPFGMFMLPGLGVGSSSLQVLGTQSPCATHTLNLCNRFWEGLYMEGFKYKRLSGLINGKGKSLRNKLYQC